MKSIINNRRRIKYISIQTIKIIRLYAIGLFFFLFANLSKAQNADFNFQSIQQGLSSKFVKCIFKDSKGFIWVGTYNGLNKYDGTNIKVYDHNSLDSTSISHGTINDIIEDDQHNIWIATAEGLSVYNKTFDNFLDLNSMLIEGENLSSTCVTALYADSFDNLWIGTLGGGLNVFNKENRTIEVINFIDGLIDGDEHLFINSIQLEKNNCIWVGTRKGLFLIDIINKKSVKYLENSATDIFFNKNISCITTDGEDGSWIATADNFLHRLKNNVGKYEVVSYDFNLLAGLKNRGNSIKALCVDINNGLWIGTENGGLKLFDDSTLSVRSFVPEEGNLNSIASNSIWSIYVDTDEKVWVGTYNKGLCLIDNYNNKFKSYQRNPFEKFSLTDNDVTGFIENKKGEIWIATDGGGISVFDLKSNKFTRPLNKRTTGKSYVNDAIKALLNDSNNDVWFGTWGSGVNKVLQNQIKNYPVISNGVGDNKILCLFEDSKNNIWAGTAGSGLFILDERHDQFIQTGFYKPGINIPDIAFVNSIFEDYYNTLWIGTMFGLYAITEDEKGKYSNQSFFYANQLGSISSNRIQCLFEDSKNNLWIGTFDKGLNLFDRKTSSFKVFQKHDGLVSNMINGILEDENGNLWLSSNRGVSKFNYLTGSIQTFAEADGLNSNEFYSGSYLKTKDGSLMFGCDNGFNLFSPENILMNPIPPTMCFTDFKLNNKSVKPGEVNSPLKQHINEAKVVVLNHKQTSFTIDFVGVSYTRSANNQYRYMMEGFDEDWIDGGNKTSATYTNLNAGKYQFWVEGTNNDGLWCKKPASVFIKIKPPLWKTNLAYFLYVFSLFGIIYFLFHIRIERIKMKNSLKLERVAREKEHELNESKLQFFTNISHDFRTPLSLIMGPLESLIASSNLNGLVKSTVFGVYKNANRLMLMVNDLMDFQKIEHNQMSLKVQYGNISKFILELTSSFKETSTQKHIEFIVNTPEKIKTGWFDFNKLEKIMLNLLSNAFKFTPDGGFVEVTLSSNSENIVITIRNSGQGISSEDLLFIFNRFYQAKSSIKKGTGIGLALVKSLVEIHKGKVEVRSIPNKDTCFEVALPYLRSAYDVNEIDETPVDVQIVDFLSSSQVFDKDVVHSDRNKKNSKPEILIVEDNDELRNYLKNELAFDFQIREAIDGSEGVEIAFNSIPDLIVSDVMMPKTDGIELCEILKKDIRTSHVPIVLLTAKTTIDDQIQGLETGADIYITKPFSIRFLKAQISQLISNREALYKTFSQQVYVIPGHFAKNKLDEEFLQKVVDFVIENISNNQLGVEAVSKSLNLSRGQAYKKIKALTGQTAVEFIRSIRLKEAIKLMETQKYSMAEIAYQTGFTSPSYFTRSFKDQYGKPPSDYVNSL